MLLSPRPGSHPSGVPMSCPHASPPPPPSRSTSSSIQGEDSCLLLIQVAPHSHNTHHSWLVNFTLGIRANICLLQPHPYLNDLNASIMKLTFLHPCWMLQCFHKRALFTLILKIFTMLQPSSIGISWSFTFILCSNFHLGTL